MNKLRIPALALCGAMLFTLAACGPKDSEATPTPGAENTPPVVETTPEATQTPEVTSTPEATQTPEVTSSPEATAPVESEQPSTPTPESSAPPAVNTPAPQPSQAPDGDPSASVTDVWNAIAADLEMPGLMDLDGDMLETLYGIKADDLEEFVAKIPFMNVHATEFFIAKVKDGKMSDVKTGIDQRLSDLKSQWESYLPDQLALVENAQVVESGNYIFFGIADGVETAVDLFTDAVK